jgi:transketolase
MADKIATREAYGKALVALAEKYPNFLVLDADLAEATKTIGFSKAYPDRFFDMGIAEANMMGVSAGLATCGKKVFANSFAMFAAGRTFEQVRNSIAYPHLNVTVVGSHGGLSVGEDGATHQCCEDIALMRTLPGMTVIVPCDGNEMTQAVEALLNYDGPAYLRLGRLAIDVVTDGVDGYKFEIGKGAQLRDGSDVTVVATGMMVQMALEAAEKLKNEGISVRVIDMHTIKPLDTEILFKAAKETGAIVTTEEHTVIGGLGSAVAEVLAETVPTKMARVGIEDVFGTSASAEVLLDYYKLNAAGIVEKTLKLLGK